MTQSSQLNILRTLAIIQARFSKLWTNIIPFKIPVLKVQSSLLFHSFLNNSSKTLIIHWSYSLIISQKRFVSYCLENKLNRTCFMCENGPIEASDQPGRSFTCYCLSMWESSLFLVLSKLLIDADQINNYF